METKSLPVREIPDMHRYCEEMGQPPFDWNAWLAKEDHDARDWALARDLASNYTTCAVGNMCASIPRFSGHLIWKDGAPKDDYLRHLGGQFYRNILKRDAASATITLAAIELRSAALLAQGKGAQS